jgi:hypothetical protein
MPSRSRFSRWGIAVLLATVALLTWMIFREQPNEPVYQGRPLGKWLRGHPNEYRLVVLALGTNALPYLLSEIQATDSRPSEWAQGMLARVSVGPFWRTARERRYHAGLGLQILDTNAVPALMEMIFSKPLRTVEGDPGYSAASALNFLGSPEAQSQVCDRIAEALRSTNAEQRRNGCLTLSLWPHPREDFAGLLVTLSADTNATVRAAAVRAIIFSEWKEPFQAALVARLNDEQAAVRRLAIEGLRLQGKMVVTALPALRAAYTNELTQPTQREDLHDGGFVVQSWSAQQIRWAIRDAIQAIDRSAPLPADPP